MVHDEYIAALNAFLKETRDAAAYKRALAVKMAFLFYDYRFVAETLCVDVSFASKWKRIFKERGVSAFASAYTGYQGRLTQEQRQSIIDWIKNQKKWDIDHLITYVEQTYQVRFASRQSYYTLYDEAGIRWKRTTARRPQHDPGQVEQKKEIKAIIVTHFDKIQRGEMVVYFIDECDTPHGLKPDGFLG